MALMNKLMILVKYYYLAARRKLGVKTVLFRSTFVMSIRSSIKCNVEFSRSDLKFSTIKTRSSHKKL